MYKDRPVFAVIAAGGTGSRFARGVPKQFRELNGKPILIWSVDLLSQNEYIDRIIVVMPKDYVFEQLMEYAIIERADGGANRQASVFAGLSRAAELAGESDALVVIQDGARPLATQDILNDAIEQAHVHGAAVAAVPVKDTIKIREADARYVRTTPDRSLLFAAQTPQAFNLNLLLEAHRSARENGFIGYDDATLVERTGGRVCLSKGSNRNIKITHEEDLVIAGALAREHASRMEG